MRANVVLKLQLATKQCVSVSASVRVAQPPRGAPAIASRGWRSGWLTRRVRKRVTTGLRVIRKSCPPRGSRRGGRIVYPMSRLACCVRVRDLVRVCLFGLK